MGSSRMLSLLTVVFPLIYFTPLFGMVSSSLQFLSFFTLLLDSRRESSTKPSEKKQQVSIYYSKHTCIPLKNPIETGENAFIFAPLRNLTLFPFPLGERSRFITRFLSLQTVSTRMRSPRSIVRRGIVEIDRRFSWIGRGKACWRSLFNHLGR